MDSNSASLNPLKVTLPAEALCFGLDGGGGVAKGAALFCTTFTGVGTEVFLGAQAANTNTAMGAARINLMFGSLVFSAMGSRSQSFDTCGEFGLLKESWVRRSNAFWWHFVLD